MAEMNIEIAKNKALARYNNLRTGVPLAALTSFFTNCFPKLSVKREQAQRSGHYLYTVATSHPYIIGSAVSAKGAIEIAFKHTFGTTIQAENKALVERRKREMDISRIADNPLPMVLREEFSAIGELRAINAKLDQIINLLTAKE